MDKFFKLKENGTTVSREIVAGLTTFFAMSYILFVNPAILSQTGMNYQAVFLATIIASIIGTFAVKLGANNYIMGALYKGLAVAGVDADAAHGERAIEDQVARLRIDGAGARCHVAKESLRGGAEIGDAATAAAGPRRLPGFHHRHDRRLRRAESVRDDARAPHVRRPGARATRAAPR